MDLQNSAQRTNLCFHNDAYYKQAEDCSILRPTDKTTTVGERTVVASWWDELIATRGYKVDYYVNRFDITENHRLYAEDPSKAYHPPKSMIVGLTMNNVAIGLGKFGFIDDSQIEFYITFEKFTAAFDGDPVFTEIHDDIEPKAGDIIHLTEFGNDRPGKREGLWYQVTSRTDEDIEKINQLGGHYVWLCKAKRLDYSFENGIPVKYPERVVSDEVSPGVFSNPPNPLTDTPAKPYPMDVDVKSSEIFDQTASGRDSVYGGY